jgi:hypothetical protein
MKPGILYFNEENVINCFINKNGQLIMPKELHQVLEEHNDLENIIISEFKWKEANK